MKTGASTPWPAVMGINVFLLGGYLLSSDLGVSQTEGS